MTVKQRYPSACLKKNMFIPPTLQKNKPRKKRGKNKGTSKTSLASRSMVTISQGTKDSARESEKKETSSGKPLSIETSAKTKPEQMEIDKAGPDGELSIMESETSQMTHVNKEGVTLEKTMSLDDFATNLANSVVAGSFTQIEKKVIDRQLSNLSDSLGNISLPKTAETSLTGPMSGKTEVSRPEISRGSVPRLSTKLGKRRPTFTTDRTSTMLTRSLPKEGKTLDIFCALNPWKICSYIRPSVFRAYIVLIFKFE